MQCFIQGILSTQPRRAKHLCLVSTQLHMRCYVWSVEHEHCGAWWLIGRFDTFRSEGRGFESRSGHHVGTLGKFFTRSVSVALRRETPTQYLCCVRSTAE